MSGPLHGVRVLDLSRVLAGPWASQILADFGADVIKVERPIVGDDTRSWGPPFLPDQHDEKARGESAYYLSANRGKKSITVDFSRPEGQAILRDLAAQSDILLENFKVGALAKLGLGVEALQKINPRLVYCSITGFGQTGPYASRAGYDFLMQGMGGLMSLTGAPDGEPMKVGVAVTDVFTGMYAVSAILAALFERDRSQLGQHIDIALFDVQIATLANQIMSFLVSGEQPRRLGNAHPSIVPYQAFKTLDSHVILAIGNDGQFARFCEVASCGHLASDPRYTANPGRVANRETLIPELQAVMLRRPTKAWISDLEAAGVPCGPINQLSDLEDDAQVIARKMFRTVHHPTGGDLKLVASPIRFSRSLSENCEAPPLLGADTDTILRERLGATTEELDTWRRSGVI